MTDELKRAMEALEENMREHAEQRVAAPTYNKCCRFTRKHGATILAALREVDGAAEDVMPNRWRVALTLAWFRPHVGIYMTSDWHRLYCLGPLYIELWKEPKR